MLVFVFTELTVAFASPFDRFLQEDLEKDEENAKSLLKLAMEGFSTRARTGDKKEIVSLLKFFRKVNENDKWLVAGVSQVLPSLHPFALKVLSRIENLGQKLQANASPSSALTVNRNLGSNERGEIGAELLELCVDYCDVNSKEAQRRVSVLAELAIKLLFFKPANPSDNDEACAMDGLKRAASFALSNVVESFPGTISAIYAAIQPKRKEFVQFMLRSPEASIQRSIIRVISILYNYKKDGRFAFVDIRATVAAFLRKTPRKSTESDAVLALFQKIDIADDNSFVQVDKFRGAAASFLDISPCLVTGPVVIGLVDSKHVSERKFTAASVDWDLNSFSVLHHRLKRLRIPWRGLMSAQWSVAGDSVAIIAEHSFLREIRVTFTSNRMQDKSDANRVYKILSQYKIPFTEVAFGREVGKPPTRKASSSQFQSTTAGTRPVHKPVVSQAEGTILGGLLNGDGLLSTASDELQVDNPPAETDGSGASREESIDVGIGPVVKTKQKPSAMKKAKSTTRQKSALNGAKQRQLRKKKSILDEDDDVPAKSRKRRLSWHDGQDGSVTQNSSGDGDGGDDSEEEDEDSDADMDDGSNVGTRDGDSSGSVSDSYFDDDMDDGHSEDGESEEEDDEELTAPSGSSLEEGSADSFVSMDDDGTDFRGKLLRIVEQRLKVCGQGMGILYSLFMKRGV